MKLALFKKGTLEQLFNHADSMMEALDYDGFGVPKQLKAGGSLAALKSMRAGGYFNFCTVKSIYKMAGLYLNPEKESFYGSLHCVDWDCMEEGVADSVMAMIFSDIKPMFA